MTETVDTFSLSEFTQTINVQPINQHVSASNTFNFTKESKFIYQHILSLSILNCVLMMVCCCIVDTSYFTTVLNNQSNMFIFNCTLFSIIQLILIIISHYAMYKQMKTLHSILYDVICQYISLIITFAVLYYTIFVYNRLSFVIDGYSANNADDITDLVDSDTRTTNNVISLYIYIVYFSCTIQTSTGFGDIQPVEWYSELLTNIQMLAGMIYSVGIFGLTLTYFMTYQANISHDNNPINVVQHVQNVLDHTFNHRIFHTMHHITNHYLLLISVCIQLLSLVLLSTLSDPFSIVNPRYSTGKILVLVLCGILVLIHLFIVMNASLKLATSVQCNTITINFLIHSYLSTCILYGLIYLFLFMSTSSHEFSHTTDLPLDIFNVFIIYLYFSITVMTSTGFGDLYARGTIARVSVMSEMLVSVVYGFIIVGLGMSHIINKLDEQAANKLKLQQMKQYAAVSQMHVA